MAPTARPVVRPRTPTSAPGSSRHTAPCTGFTLVELLVVMVLIGLATAVVSLALRDPSAYRLDQEAARLGALLEAGRAEARASGLPVRFRTKIDGPSTRYGLMESTTGISTGSDVGVS